MRNKIDFVIMWVDGNDPQWQEEKAKFSNNQGDRRNIRFRDWDNLQYWFRGVEKYANWVNKIHFVTWGHVPSWLNTDHPKINIVNHKDIINNDYLPVFNSRAIEVNLHRIPGLSEQFVYFNDDMFIIKKVKKEDFFRNGLPCDNATPDPTPSRSKVKIGTAISNNMGIINTHFNKRKQIMKNLSKWYNPKYGRRLIAPICMLPWGNFASFATAHIPHSYLKSTFKEVWEKEPEILELTSKTRFRNSDNVNQWLMRYWQLASGQFYPRNPKIGENFMLKSNNKDSMKVIKKQKYKMICLNDTMDISDFNHLKQQIINSFNKILPNKSNYEV